MPRLTPSSVPVPGVFKAGSAGEKGSVVRRADFALRFHRGRAAVEGMTRIPAGFNPGVCATFRLPPPGGGAIGWEGRIRKPRAGRPAVDAGPAVWRRDSPAQGRSRGLPRPVPLGYGRISMERRRNRRVLPASALPVNRLQRPRPAASMAREPRRAFGVPTRRTAGES